MLKKLLSLAVLALPLLAQVSPTKALVSQQGTLANRPTSCSVGQLFFASDQTPGKNVYGCTSGNTWTLQGDGTGTGTVTSVTIAGTTNQIVVSGSCTGTTTISCTLSIPSGFVLPGTIDGLTITTTTGTFTLAAAKTFTVNNSVTLVGTDAATYTFPTGTSTLGVAPVTAVNASITTTSLGTQAICALHTDSGCSNSVTDATTANCPAGTLTATCTFPTSITIPANTLGSTATSMEFLIGSINTATIPTALVEVYLNSTRIFAGGNVSAASGSKSNKFNCMITSATSGVAAPLAIGCSTTASFGTPTQFGGNGLNTNLAPAVAIDTTINQVLKVSVSFSAATTGNAVWLYGMRFQP